MKIDFTFFKSDKIPLKERKIKILYGTTEIKLKDEYKDMSAKDIIRKTRKK